MGTYIQIFKFPNQSAKRKFEEHLESYVGSAKTYSRIILNLGDKSFEVPLKILIEKVPVQQSIVPSGSVVDKRYRIKADVPREVVHLDGKWNIKEMEVVEYVSYGVDPIASYSLLVGSSKRGVRGVSDALRRLGLSVPVQLKIRFAHRSFFVEMLRELGSIGWVYIGEIPDYHVKGAMFHGVRLEDSDVFRDLVERGGRIRAIVIYNEVKRVKIILSEGGTIYSQQKLDGETAAEEIKDIIETFQHYGLIGVA